MSRNKDSITVHRSKISLPCRRMLFPSPFSSTLRKIGLALSFAIFLVLGSSVAPALAYDGSGASNWADNNYSPNTLNPSFDENCTNFVSQAMHKGGGFSYVNDGQSYSDNHNWWLDKVWWGWSYSHAFTVTPELYNFLQWHYPGGYNWGSASGSGTSGHGDPLVAGDVLFYDFGDGQGMTHAAMQVNGSYDPTKGWSGPVVDAQTNSRYHAYWSLEPYNAFAYRTTITFEHVDAGNN